VANSIRGRRRIWADKLYSPVGWHDRWGHSRRSITLAGLICNANPDRNGNHSLDNLGDIAILCAAAERLAECWPQAELRALTREPARLVSHVPLAAPETIPSRRWQRALARLADRLPPSSARHMRRALETADQWLPALSYQANHDQLVAGFDLVVLSGCGLLADAFRLPAMRRLQLLGAAQRAGIATALVSQGLGPIEHPALLQLAGRVLPQAQYTPTQSWLGRRPLLPRFHHEQFPSGN